MKADRIKIMKKLYASDKEGLNDYKNKIMRDDNLWSLAVEIADFQMAAWAHETGIMKKRPLFGSICKLCGK